MPPESFIVGLRRLIHTVRGANLNDVASLEDHTRTLTEIADAVEPHVVPGTRMQAALTLDEVMERLAKTEGRRERIRSLGLSTVFPYSPYVGPLNPLAPPAHVVLVDGDGEWNDLTGEVVFGDAYNGPPGSVHGGVIAGLFDEMLGAVCVANDVGGFTGTLTIRYRSPTPLETPIQLRGWIDRIEGRKTYALGTFHVGETLLAEADGVFISADGLPSPI